MRGLIPICLALCGALVSPALHAGDLQFYASVPRNISEALVNGFMSKNPDVKVSLFQAGNEVVLEKLELEIRSAGRPAADVVWIQEPAALQRFGKRGLLEKYTPANVNNIRESFRDPDGYYTGTAVTFVVLMYNTKLVPRERVPTAWSSLTDARYRNQVILANPQVSGTGAAVASALYQNYGWSFWEQVAKNRPILAAGHPAMISTVIAGERRLSPMQDLSIVEATKKGQPVGYTIPSDGAIAVGCYAAIVRPSKNLADAKRFVDFLAGDAAAVILTNVGMYHTSLKAKPPEGWPPLNDIKLMPFDWNKHEATKNEIKVKFSELMER